MKHRTFELSLERGDLLPLLLMMPTLAIILFIMIVPLVYGLFLTFFEAGFGLSGTSDFAGLGNWERFFQDETSLKSALNTVCFALGATAGDLFLGTICALLLVKLPRMFSSVFRPIVTMPLLVSPVVVGLIWRYIYDPRGILYYFLGLFGLGIEDFPGVTMPSTALLSTIIAHWWQVTPFVVIVLTAGLLSIPDEYYEAARIDGAGAFNVFFRITLPQLRNVYMTILVISGVDTIKIFDIIYALTGGGPNNSTISLSIYGYNQAFVQSNLNYAMVISIMTMVLSFVIFGIPFVRNNIAGNKE